MFKNINRYFLLLIILLVSLRLVIGGIYSGLDRLILLGSCASLFYFVAIVIFKNRVSLNAFWITYALSFISFIIYFLYYFLISKDKVGFFNFVSERTFSTVFASNIVLLAFSSLTSRSLIWVLDHATKFLTAFSGIVFILNSYFKSFSKDYFRAEDIAWYVFDYDKQVVNQRIVGVLINLENSAVLLLMSFIYYFHRFIVSKIQKKEQVRLLPILISGIGFVGLLSTASITTMVVVVVVLGVMSLQLFSFSIYKKLSFKKQLQLLMIFSGLIFAFKSHIVFFFKRVLIYINDPSQFFGRISLDVGDSFRNFWWNSNISDLKSNGFGINEVHVLLSFSFVGLVPTLCWYLVFISPVYFMMKFKILGNLEKSVLYMMIAAFVSSLHYAGVTAWPNNLLYFICFIILYRHVEKKSLSFFARK